MEGKKLTDEEIVKAWECHINGLVCDKQCPYKVKGISCLNGRHARDTLDLIHRWKAENERLTEENAILKGNPPMIVGRSNGKTIRAKLLAFDKMKERNAELQKQVDELMGFKNEAISMSLYGKGRKDGEEGAVKATAKEVLQMLHDIGGCDATDEWSKGYDAAIDTAYEAVKKRYGVEVE